MLLLSLEGVVSGSSESSPLLSFPESVIQFQVSRLGDKGDGGVGWSLSFFIVSLCLNKGFDGLSGLLGVKRPPSWGVSDSVNMDEVDGEVGDVGESGIRSVMSISGGFDMSSRPSSRCKLMCGGLARRRVLLTLWLLLDLKASVSG